jgi:hypothetical protein
MFIKTLIIIIITQLGINGQTSFRHDECNDFFKNVSRNEISEDDYSFIILPDLQNMTSNYPGILSQMFTWIIDNKQRNNIQAVISLGDLTNFATDSEYKTISTQFMNLNNAEIVNLPVIGNHDYDFSNPASRSTTKFDTYFPDSNYYSQIWYGNSYHNSMSNSYIKVNAGNQKYLIMGLEIFPRNEVLDWAQKIINENTDKEIIIVTHSYLNNNGTRTTSSDWYGSSSYNLGNDNDAVKMWNNFIKVNENIHYVLSGHQICLPTSAYSIDINNYRTRVLQLFFNHQCVANGGNGFLIIMKFSPLTQTVNIKTYSPFLNNYDSLGEYNFPFIIDDCNQASTPTNFNLGQNYPNPFNSSTTIMYSLPLESKVTIKIYTLLGQEIMLFKDEVVPAGNNKVRFNSSGLSSGVYFYRLSVESIDEKQKYSSLKKMMLMK